MSCTTRFLMSSNSQVYWRTASAVPWNHSLSVGVCVAASTCSRNASLFAGCLVHRALLYTRTVVTLAVCCRPHNAGRCLKAVPSRQRQCARQRRAELTSTKPSPPKRTPEPRLYVRARCRFSDVELNWVST